MKRLFIFTMMCIFGLFSLNAQNAGGLNPVRWVSVVENETSVDVEWNMGFSDSELEDFELGSFAKKDWKNDGAYPWVITEDAYQGNFAMKSSCEKVNDTTSSIEIEVNVPYDGFVTFNHRVSSEDNADYGNFYIDNVLQTTISGNREWRYAEVYVTAGTHTYKWEYTKDGSRHTYADAYFVDNVVLYKAIEVKEGWIGNDNDQWATSIGTGAVSPTYWGISFPVTKQYAGLTLTKLAVFDAAKGGSAQYTANIYFGGETAPETLVSTKQFTLSGADQMVEVELSTPVTIDGTQPLWITFYCDQSAYPVASSLKSEYLTTDWLSIDGKDWKHAPEYGLNGSWMIKGYLENAAGKVRVLSSAKSEDAAFTSKYNLYRKDLYNTTELLAENIDATSYTDNAWETFGTGAYKWGVAALYEGGVESEIVWSNTIAKDMSTEVTVSVKTNSEDPVAGTSVNFVNKVESKYSYSITLGGGDVHTFANFRKGTYEVSILKNGFSSDYDATTVEIWEPKEIECLLTEELAPAEDLYVSPTGWVMWKGSSVGAGDEFYFDFEDGTLNGWTTIDADNDNYTWQNSIEIMAPGSGHNSSIACVTSMSWLYGVVLTPDNYLVTENKYKIDETSKLRFWVCAQDVVAPNDHYGVAVSLGGNTNPDEFVTIWEETLTAKSGVRGIRDTKEQGTWYEKVVDLSDYAGQEIYIALRHFDCTDQFYVNVDDVSLETEDRSGRALESYNIYLNDELVAENLTKTYYQHEGLVDGQEYVTKVVPVYTTGNGAELSYTWKKVACDKFEGVKDLTAKYTNGVTTISWTMPESETKSNTRAQNWLKYDNGEYVDGIGLAFPNESGYIEEYEQIKWAVMFPSADVAEYAGCPITKISLFDNEAYEGEVSIYEGGSSSPGTLLHTQAYTATGSNAFQEVALTKTINISGNKNVWVVLTNKNGGQQPAAGCMDQGNPNARWLQHEAYEILGNGGWIDNQFVMAPPLRTWMIRACVETPDPAPEALGVMVCRNGEIISKLVEGETFVDEKSQVDDEYSLRVIYGGEKDKSYYAMSCPQTIVADVTCPSPKPFNAYAISYPDGRFGTMLAYPYLAPTSEWLKYDDGYKVESLGGDALTTFYWGVKFPVETLEDYAGTSITKVMCYDYVYESFYDGSNEFSVEIYFGGETSPELLIHAEKYVGTGAGEFVEIELSYPLPVSGEENIWVIMKTNAGSEYPAAIAKDCGDRNGRWISLDGDTWEDLANAGISGTFMIRAFVTNERGVATSIDPSTRDLSLKNYNIYRGTALENVELVASTPDKSYFDEIEKGTYYYQVTAVYEEEGVECESEPAKVYNDETRNYIVVEVTAIEENGVNGLMIYPNPTNGNLNINVEAMRRITIANALGQVVYDQEVNSDSEVIDMAEYQAGVYMVRIATDNGVAVKRISVVR